LISPTGCVRSAAIVSANRATRRANCRAVS
jgi:hypothetical protein